MDPSAAGGNLNITDLITQGAQAADSNAIGAHNGIIVGADSFIGKVNTLRASRYNEQIAIVTGNSSQLFIGPDTIADWNMGGGSASAYAVTGTSSKIIKAAQSIVTSGSGSISDGSGKIYQASYAVI